MPDYLQELAIDWGWRGLRDDEQAIARRWEARIQAQPADHTLQTAREWLADASRELPGRALRARAIDDAGEHLLRAFDGRCTVTAGGPFDPSGVFPGELTVDDYRAAGVDTLAVTLFLPEPLLAAVRARAAALDWSHSRLVQEAWNRAPAPAAAVATDAPSARLTVYLPLDTYAAIEAAAATRDCSKSRVVRDCLAAALPTIVG